MYALIGHSGGIMGLSGGNLNTQNGFTNPCAIKYHIDQKKYSNILMWSLFEGRT